MTADQSSRTPHALYRFYSASGQLLYIGITLDPGSRWKAHRKDKPWWSEVAQMTVEQHPGRVEVLRAERAAIIAERPLYNVIHNGGKAPAEPPVVETAANAWTYRTRRGHERTTDLYLHWEVDGDPITDSYTPDEITARELLDLWSRSRSSDTPTIYWSIFPVHETAPFQRHRWITEDFLTHFTWPVHAATGDPLNFNRLPVLDKDWSRAGDKGGFLQEVTGWKPAPLQPRMDVAQVFAAARLTLPVLRGAA